MNDVPTRDANDDEQAKIIAFIDELHALYLKHRELGTPDWLIGNGMAIGLCSFAIYTGASLEILQEQLPMWYQNATSFDADREKGGNA